MLRKMVTWIRRKNAVSGLDRELDPPLRLPVKFRPYEKRDFDPLMEVYKLNAPGRFPPDNEMEFAEYLQTLDKGLVVGELKGKTICCGGLIRMGTGIYTFCYGLIHPQYQRQRIGSTLTLLRVAATRGDQLGTINYALINAVPTSMPFYRRFDFTEYGTWTAKDGETYPSACMLYYVDMAHRIDSILRWRRIKIEGQFEPSVNKDYKLKIVKDDKGNTSLTYDK